MKKEKKTPWFRRKKYWVIALIAIALIFAGRAFSQGASKPRETATVKKETVREELVLSGELKATQAANLQFNSSGTLSWVGVTVGQNVTKGQALMKLDTVLLNSAYQQSLAALKIAEATVARVHDDLKGKDSTETFTEREERVSAEGAKDRAYESFVASQKALRDATLVAPFAGMVAHLTNESAGMNVTGGTLQAVVVNPSTLYFLVNADQTDVSKIKVGNTAEITLDSFPDEKISGKVTQVSFAPNTAESGTVYPIRLELSVDNSSYKYKLGMTGDTSFTLSQKENVLALPPKFVKSDREGKFIYVDDKNTKKYVELGIEGDSLVEIRGDVSEGQIVYN